MASRSPRWDWMSVDIVSAAEPTWMKPAVSCAWPSLRSSLLGTAGTDDGADTTEGAGAGAPVSTAGTGAVAWRVAVKVVARARTRTAVAIPIRVKTEPRTVPRV